MAALHATHESDPADKAALIRLQNTIVGPRYAATDWRDYQNLVGETKIAFRHEVHFLCPRPEDVPALMQGWTALTTRMLADGIEPIVAAAGVAFTFVSSHPFEDGNGRLHRFLIHHVLSRTGFDATPFAEHLDDRIIDTVRVDLREELGFLAMFDRAMEAVAAGVDMPDRRASLLIRLLLQSEGHLSAAKRPVFAELTDAEIAGMEAAVAKAAMPLPATVNAGSGAAGPGSGARRARIRRSVRPAGRNH